MVRSLVRRITNYHKMRYVYILKLRDGSYYVGSTSDLKKRIKYHNYGKVPHTRKLLPVKLVQYSAFSSKEKASGFEKYLKSGSGTAFRNKRLI